ncbi:CAP domain-containing protein [Paraliobacillus sediminis]|uniref:CAP domain-containing protein n=1 Tax=Paraliobacillus sediminis TaxID=1885916 RepID=UPI001F0743AF|nr:CAP domain-containing protein [Paraliobacillus sediminis]
MKNKLNDMLWITLICFIVLAGCGNQQADQIERSDDQLENTDMTTDPISFGGGEQEPSEGNRNATRSRSPFPIPGKEQNIFTTEPERESAQDEGIRTTPEETERDEATNQSSSQFQTEVTNLTNKEREKNGLAKLEIDKAVEDVAQKKSEDMATNNYFSHTSPTYGSPFEMLQQFEVDYTTAAENIAAGQQSPQEVVTGWMNSPGHRKNILNEKVTHIGVGYAENGAYWTQLFIGK